MISGLMIKVWFWKLFEWLKTCALILQNKYFNRKYIYELENTFILLLLGCIFYSFKPFSILTFVLFPFQSNSKLITRNNRDEWLVRNILSLVVLHRYVYVRVIISMCPRVSLCIIAYVRLSDTSLSVSLVLGSHFFV